MSKNLSAIARAGACLFLACDEAAGVERLTRQGDGRFGAHQYISLTGFFDLPGDPDQEMDIEGLGIRDLRLDGEDLLLLVGPTMALEGTAHVLRWRGAIHDQAEGLVPRERLENVADPPCSRNADHPEGLELWPEAGRNALMVVYDAPAGKRLERAGRTVRADVLLADPS